MRTRKLGVASVVAALALVGLSAQPAAAAPDGRFSAACNDGSGEKINVSWSGENVYYNNHCKTHMRIWAKQSGGREDCVQAKKGKGRDSVRNDVKSVMIGGGFCPV